ncbi:hypothetical protein [Streptomyces abyssomicinicus]|uniref:hypothetical protein n=1 Tax=Streptomyces abyssomicinicus TaxID=574929 RepID=UPI00124F86A3|nr:hypothetical protein [Streptomyces abyssomicinicus]
MITLAAGSPTFTASFALVIGLVFVALGAFTRTARGSAWLRGRGGPPLTRFLPIGWLVGGTLFALAGLTVLVLVDDDPVRDRWESRTPYAGCGEVRLRQGERMETHAAREIDCLRRAVEETATAELAVTFPTVEGDPIREYYRLTPQGRLEVYTDSTDDPHSDRTWSFSACHAPEWLPEISCPRR